MAELWSDKDDPKPEYNFITDPKYSVIRIAIFTTIILGVYFYFRLR